MALKCMCASSFETSTMEHLLEDINEDFKRTFSKHIISFRGVLGGMNETVRGKVRRHCQVADIYHLWW